jgi:two-component system LytT family response regulator
MDYLVKPVRIADLTDSVAKVLSSIPDDDYGKRLETARLQFNDPSRIILPEPAGFTVIETKDIIKLEADLTYTHFFLTGRRKLTYHRVLKSFEDLLGIHPNFMRVHRSHLVNLDHVQSYSTQGVIKLTDGLTAPLGDSFREKFEDYFR